MQFTPDGYTEPLPMRIPQLLIGVLLVGVGIAVTYSWSGCVGALVIVVGALLAGNEGGLKRIRVTRRHLLLEDEFRVRGLLIGPVRNRVRWEDTKEVVVDGDAVKLTQVDGTVLRLAVGGPGKELETLRDRILQRLESYNNPVE